MWWFASWHQGSKGTEQSQFKDLFSKRGIGEPVLAFIKLFNVQNLRNTKEMVIQPQKKTKKKHTWWKGSHVSLLTQSINALIS